MNSEKQKRRWLRFSLRTFLALVLVCSVVFGWAASELEKVRRERAAVEALWFESGEQIDESAYGNTIAVVTEEPIFGDDGLYEAMRVCKSVELVYGKPPRHIRWLMRLTGTTYGYVKEVHLSGSEVTDGHLRLVAQLPNVTIVEIKGTSVTENGLSQLRSALPGTAIIQRPADSEPNSEL